MRLSRAVPQVGHLTCQRGVKLPVGWRGTLIGFLAFVVVHVTLVALTGFARNMNHIVLGTDDVRPTGMILGFIGIGLVLLYWVAARYISWYFPRGLQHVQKAITEPVKLLTLDRLIPREHYTKDQISPHFWPNGKMPVREDWKQLAADSFKSYKLKVSGLVDNPIELSIEEMRALGAEESITMHHCIQGWSGIAQWRGISMRKLRTGMVTRLAIRQMLAAARTQETQVLEKPHHRAWSGRTRGKILYMPRRSPDDSCNN